MRQQNCNMRDCKVYSEYEAYEDCKDDFDDAERAGVGTGNIDREIRAYIGENISYWTKRAPGYSDVNQEELRTRQRKIWSQALDSRIQAHFGGRDRSDIHILDVGTGPGFFAIILTELGYRVTAVDYTAAMLEQARANAGALADRIQFHQMNAEELSFEDGRFDVIVSRNLTWNLPMPERAYAHWTRVLKSDGLMLNFDANWYRYLYDANAQNAHLSDRENVQTLGAADDTAGTDVDAMEAIARQAPLSRHTRPQWDRDILKRLGMKVAVDTEIWRQVWTRDEWINNASTPMFLISASKTAQI